MFKGILHLYIEYPDVCAISLNIEFSSRSFEYSAALLYESLIDYDVVFFNKNIDKLLAPTGALFVSGFRHI